MNVTTQQLRAIVPGLSAERAAWVLADLDVAATWAGITTPQRMAAFIAQLAHESCGFKYLKELWGPTPAQLRYEGRKDLGNTQPGDGRRYCGRGFIQLTGRHNYRKYGALLNLPLEAQPELAERPDVAWRVAAAYWRDRNINALADAGDFVGVTRKINGGTNGLADRQAYHERALKALTPQAGRVLLAVPGRPEEPQEWDGKPAIYGGTALSPGVIEMLRTVYPLPGGPWQYEKLRVWVRRNGDLVLDKTPSRLQ